MPVSFTSAFHRKAIEVGVIVMLVASPAVPAHACTTDLVRVYLGCTPKGLVEFTATVTDTVGDQEVNLKLQPDGSYEGHVRRSVQPEDEKMMVDLAILRTNCNVAGEPERIGNSSCRAAFHVACDPIWSLGVSSEADEKMKMSYRCPKGKKPITVCQPETDTPAEGSLLLPPKGSRTISPLGFSQEVVLALTVPQVGAFNFSIFQKTLAQRNGTARLSDLKPNATTPSAVTSNPNLDQLKQTQAEALDQFLLKAIGSEN